jgi:hypothetical protein
MSYDNQTTNGSIGGSISIGGTMTPPISNRFVFGGSGTNIPGLGL